MPTTPASTTAQSNTKGSAEKREFFVVGDVSSMPMRDSRPLFDSFGQWVSAAFRHKVLGKSIEPDYLLESRRFKSARHVPKRIQKYFDSVGRELTSLGFVESFHGTTPALGPYSTATLGMSRKDGEIHFFATQIVTQTASKIHDENYFGFISWLRDDGSVWTLSPSRLPSSRSGVDRVALTMDKPSEILRKHRERIRRSKLRPVAPSDYFSAFESEHIEQAMDWSKRGIIRKATPAEVTRVRNMIEA